MLLISSNPVEVNKRGIIGNRELDIYLPNQSLAIEYNGVYWHTDQFVDKSYHKDKTRLCNVNGIELLHIFSNEWNDPIKREIWQSIIRNKLGDSDRIYARKCLLKPVSFKESSIFLEYNHLQGSGKPSLIRYGLYYQDELVSLMTFCKSRYDKKCEYELLRFVNKCGVSVIGGASRLFKHFVKMNKPNGVVSYSDNRISEGSMYRILGFGFEHESSPNYFYTKDFKTLHSRVKYQKHKLKDKLDVYDDNLSEYENMRMNKFFRIYDCGNKVWLYNKKGAQ